MHCARTTLPLDDDVFRLVKRYARAARWGWEKRYPNLCVAGFSCLVPHVRSNGLQVFDLPGGVAASQRKEGPELEAEQERPSCLDVNVLIALMWPAHEGHARVQHWFRRNSRQGWATCPLTQAPFVRIVSNPAFSPDDATRSSEGTRR